MGSAVENVRVVGRYALYQAIAAGGMATVHLGRLLGPVGFSRTVALKRLHAQFASDPEFVSMFLDEARLAARIRHPNVVPTLDVVAAGGELFLVMEYVPGESVARLARALRERRLTIPLRILSSVMAGVLHGLHAAHEAKDERGQPLGIVHRDMSPQNVLVGTDGVARVLDFGVAKAAGRMQTTRDGQIKGKLSYMPPEQLRGVSVDHRADIYAAGVMLWELVTGQRLFGGDNEGMIVAKVLAGEIEAPSVVLQRSTHRKQTLNDNVMRPLQDLDATILRALAMAPEDRFTTAREMAVEIERKVPPATGSEVADWVEHIAKDVLSSRAAMVAEIESSTTHTAFEPQEGHVQSVLAAKSTLAPSAKLLQQNLKATVPDAPRADWRGAFTSYGSAPAPPSPSIPIEGPPVTQPSSISVATGEYSRVSARGRSTMKLALLALLLSASLFAGALVWRRSEMKARDAAVAKTTAPPPTVPPALTTGSDAPPRPFAAATAPADAVDAAVSSPPAAAVPVASATAKPKAVRPASSKPSAAAAAAAAAAADCATPFWFDEHEVKHYKPQCFDK